MRLTRRVHSRHSSDHLQSPITLCSSWRFFHSTADPFSRSVNNVTSSDIIFEHLSDYDIGLIYVFVKAESLTAHAANTVFFMDSITSSGL